MRNKSLVLAVLFFILFPIVIFAISNVDWLRQSWTVFRYTKVQTKNPQIAVASRNPLYEPKISHTGYLDFIFAQMKIFDQQAIVDPTIYSVNKLNSKRYTISRVRIELVPTLESYLLGIGGVNDFAARATYTVEGDTMVILVSLNTNEIPESKVTESYALEDTYIQAALQTLVYATGTMGKPINFMQLSKLNTQYTEYLKSGMFQRPIIIERKDI